MHVTTRIPGRKYDGLLKENGFRGFPTLCFMDADGNVLLSRVDRTIAGFEAGKKRVEHYLELARRAAAGDTSVAKTLLLTRIELRNIRYDEVRKTAARLDLDAPQRRVVHEFLLHEIGRLDLEHAKKRLNELRPELSEAMAKQADLVLNDIKIAAHVKQMSATARASGGRMSREIWYDMYRKGMIPSPRSGLAFSYWNGVAIFAEKAKDIPAFTAAVDGLRRVLGNGPNRSYVERLQKRLAALRGS